MLRNNFSLGVSLWLTLACTWTNFATADIRTDSTSSYPFYIAKQYVTEFYPLLLSFEQRRVGSPNRIVGPDRISPIYHFVVAINDDTLYASSFVNVKDQPLVVTIPSTVATYSILALDPYGNIFETGIQTGTPGTYALTGPGWVGTLPEGVKPFAVPVNFFTLIFRADKFSATGQDQTTEADQFRRSLRSQTLSDYVADPSGGTASIVLKFIQYTYKDHCRHIGGPIS